MEPATGHGRALPACNAAPGACASCGLWGRNADKSHNREPRPRALGEGVALKRVGRACYNADYLGMGPRAGGGAGIINYQPGPAGRLAGRGGVRLT